MEQFDALLRVAEKLLGPNGCPWDLTQTFQSLQTYVLEEAHEVVEAVDAGDDAKILEELGDLLYTVVFYAKLAEKAHRFSMEQILSTIREKLIRRHPHIFSGVAVNSVDEVISNWEEIKKQEKKDRSARGIGEGIPPTLSGLMRGQKIMKKILAKDPQCFGKQKAVSEEEIAQQLLSLLAQAVHNGIDTEGALRRALQQLILRFE